MPAKPNNRINWLSIALTLLVFIALLFAAMALVSGAQSLHLLQQLDWRVIGAALLLSLINYALRYFRWRCFSQRIGLKLAVFDDALIWLSGFALATTPAKLGEGLRVWGLQRRFALHWRPALSLLLADKLADAQAVLLLLIGAALVTHQFSISELTLLLLLIAAVALLWLPQMTKLGLTLLYRLLLPLFALRRQASVTRIAARLRRVLRLNVHQLSGQGRWLLIISLLGWSAETTGLYLISASLGFELEWWYCAVIYCAAIFAGVISLLPGGLGSTEASMVAMLMFANVDAATAVVITAVSRLTTLWFAVLVGLICSSILLPRLKRQKTMQRTNKLITDV